MYAIFRLHQLLLNVLGISKSMPNLQWNNSPLSWSMFTLKDKKQMGEGLEELLLVLL